MNTIVSFFEQNAQEIAKTIPAPIYLPDLTGHYGDFNNAIIKTTASLALINGSTKLPKPAQLEKVIAPISFLFLEKGERAAVINGEQGSGKTIMSNTIAYTLYKNEYEPKNKGFKTGIFASSTTHIGNLKNEAKSLFGDLADIFVIVNKPRKKHPEEITFEEAISAERVPGRISYYIISKDIGKSGLKRKFMKVGDKCPSCGESLAKVNRSRSGEVPFCGSCKSPTYTMVGKKESSASKLKRFRKNKHHKVFDFFTVDEVHEFGYRDSLQSQFYRAIVSASFRAIVMTGTFTNGYASSAMYTLFSMFAKQFKDFANIHYDDVNHFISLFGTFEYTRTEGRAAQTTKELPQISERIIAFLAPFTVWFSVSDLGIKMPKLTESEVLSSIDHTVYKAFSNWEESIKDRALSLIKAGVAPEHISLNIARFDQAMSYRLDNPAKRYTHEINYFVPNAEDPLQNIEKTVYVDYTPIPDSYITNKERALIAHCKTELAEGRRVLVYGVHNESTGVYQRLQKILAEAGIKSDIMPKTLQSLHIEDWITSPDREDVVIVPQKRVATGLNLVQFATVMFYELSEVTNVVSQSKVRPWRPFGQDKDVRILYLAFHGAQAKKLANAAHKMRASATVNGKQISADTIAAIYDYNPEMTLAVNSIADNLKEMEDAENEGSMAANNTPFALRYIEVQSMTVQEVQEVQEYFTKLVPTGDTTKYMQAAWIFEESGYETKLTPSENNESYLQSEWVFCS